MLIDKTLTQSKTLQFGLMAAELKRQGREIISLGLGEPEFDTPQHIKQAAKDALDAGFTRYSAAAGLPELRELVAEKLQNENDISATAKQIIITPGAKNALFLACAALLRPGDEVINFNPCYVSNNPIIKLAEPRTIVHNIPMSSDDFTIDKDGVASLVNKKTKLVFINYPNNPTGKMLCEDEAQFICDLVRENDLYLLSDEIYERITFGQTTHVSPASFAQIADKVITVNGFSKAYSMTGWRIGYVHAAADLVAVMIKIQQQINTNTAAFIQKGAIAALTGPQDHIETFITNLKERKGMYDSLVANNKNLTGSNPQGGFFAFLNIGATGLSSDEFATQLLDETGVAVIPGISFGADFDNFCRLSLVNETEQVKQGLELINQFVNNKVRNR
ncbi:MAG: pyridoxal phosphate-dependent aminotransferase [Sedimentisphaerales bacterium]|nr:pyridoxal phosphate-dependent aminotransferase [Sedimentisphaerales bacterium]